MEEFAEYLGSVDITGKKDTDIVIPVTITNTSQALIAIETLITLDKNVIELIEVQNGDLTSEWRAPYVRETNGQYTIGAIGMMSTPIPAGISGTVLNIILHVIGNPGTRCPLDFSGIKLINTSFQTGTSTPSNAIFTVSSPTPETPITTYAIIAIVILAIIIILIGLKK